MVCIGNTCFNPVLLGLWGTFGPWGYITVLADVVISPNPNTFNFWPAKYEYIKKTGVRIHFFFKIEGIRESNYYESIYDLESEYISFLP